MSKELSFRLKNETMEDAAFKTKIYWHALLNLNLYKTKSRGTNKIKVYSLIGRRILLKPWKKFTKTA